MLDLAQLLVQAQNHTEAEAAKAKAFEHLGAQALEMLREELVRPLVGLTIGMVQAEYDRVAMLPVEERAKEQELRLEGWTALINLGLSQAQNVLALRASAEAQTASANRAEAETRAAEQAAREEHERAQAARSLAWKATEASQSPDPAQRAWASEIFTLAGLPCPPYEPPPRHRRSADEL